MNEEKLIQMLKDIGQADVPANVALIAEQTSQSFTAALNLLQSQRKGGLFTGFKLIAAAAIILVTFGLGLSVGRWSKPTSPFNVAAYSPAMSAYPTYQKKEDGFWQQKAIAVMQSRPQFNQSALLNAYKQYLKEKHND